MRQRLWQFERLDRPLLQMQHERLATGREMGGVEAIHMLKVPRRMQGSQAWMPYQELQIAGGIGSAHGRLRQD